MVVFGGIVGIGGTVVSGNSARQLLIDVDKIFTTCHIELHSVCILATEDVALRQNI